MVTTMLVVWAALNVACLVFYAAVYRANTRRVDWTVEGREQWD